MLWMKNKVLLLFLGIIVLSCTNEKGSVFKKHSSSKTNILFSNDLTVTNNLSILDYLYFYNGGGIAIGDINNDSLPDLFFSGNQVKNKLYLNKGDFTFEDISATAGIEGNSSWNTGSVMADVNGDGLLDIYVCAVVGLNGFNGRNELYINQGNGQFKESARSYGIDFESYSSSAAFFDYDLDGDLDMYLLNHAVHTPKSFGGSHLRRERSYETGDKLLRNDNGKFKDVSEEAGIYGGINGYSLGIAVSDFNIDGYPDLYIGNDFHEDDYYYLNNGDGTFKECLKTYFGHTTRFSMGSDVADLNHDGLPDLLSLDMLPDDEMVLKESEGDDNIQIQKLRINNYGYHYQFTRNMLYLNQPDGKFMETALQSGIAATDWSWSALFGDYDQDGEQDLYITNGIPKRPNNLDFINYASNANIKIKLNNTNLIDDEAMRLMPSGTVPNRIFQGQKNLRFKDQSISWIPKDTLVSGATAYADLDNDGDLDLVTNNINTTPLILENLTNTTANYIKLTLNYKKPNAYGIGTKVYSYANGALQFKELYTSRGFQSSSEPIVHFGYGQIQTIDSIKIIWPDRTTQTLKKLTANQNLHIKYENTIPFDYTSFPKKKEPIFVKTSSNLGIDFIHKEDVYTDFNRQKLIPYQISDRGPATSVGDMDGDGKQDLFFGGSKYTPSQVFIQKDSIFKATKIESIKKDSIKEDIVSVLGDFNQNGKNDLIIGTGGGDFYNEMNPLTNSYYQNKDSSYTKVSFPKQYANTSVVLSLDYDNDNDLDLFIGNQTITGDFGKLPNSYILKNTNGVFSIDNTNIFDAVGMVTAAIAEDFDSDGDLDIIMVGEWMSPKFYENNKGKYSLLNLPTISNLNGLWQSIIAFDIDLDGDMDYLLGNWGENSKFNASSDYPLKMYYGDFDKNGATETIVATYKNGDYYPLEGLNELSSQLVYLRKKFNTYASFAGKPVPEVLGKEAYNYANTLNVQTLQSGYLENRDGSYIFTPFKFELQTAPLMDFLVFDFDKDGKKEVLVGGNYFGVKPFHGRYDSFPGALIYSKNNIILGSSVGLDFMSKSVRHLNIIHLNNLTYLLVTMNNDEAQVYELIN